MIFTITDNYMLKEIT